MEVIVSSPRQKELTADYIRVLEEHLQELKNGKVDRAKEIRDFAAMLYVHPVHLSNTIKETTGRSTCDWYEDGLLRVSKELLLETSLSIGDIAIRLTYDPSNFTKFFKAFTGITPKVFRQMQLKESEAVTI